MLGCPTVALRYCIQVESPFHRIDENGLTLAHTDDLRPGVHLRQGDYVVVGDEDAEPAIAVVTQLDDDGFMRLRVLPGPASEYVCQQTSQQASGPPDPHDRRGELRLGF